MSRFVCVSIVMLMSRFVCVSIAMLHVKVCVCFHSNVTCGGLCKSHYINQHSYLNLVKEI